MERARDDRKLRKSGGAARLRARYTHVTGTMLGKVAQQVGDALRELPTAD
jgi:hypothetical protein